MKVGILGTGDVGQALARGFAARGHEVMLGSRDPKAKRHTAWQSKTKGAASVGTIESAAGHGEIVVLAVPGEAADEVLRTAGVRNFAGKLVIDVTNAIDSWGSRPTLHFGISDSVGERIQKMIPDAKVVKAFNAVPSSQMVDPKFAGGAPSMLIAGNDARAKQQVVTILKEFGWPGALDIGKIEMARWLEALVVLWYFAGEALDRWDHAFKVVHG